MSGKFRSPRGDDPILPFIRINVWTVKTTVAAFVGAFFGAIGSFYLVKFYQLSQGDTAGFMEGPYGSDVEFYAMMGGAILLPVLSTIQDTFTWGWWD